VQIETRPVPASERNLSGVDFFLLWAGVAISLAEIWAGGFLVPMGFWPALWAILIGHVIGNSFMALAGVIGSEQGVMAMVSVRPSFGTRGSALPAVLNVVQLVCWASIMLIIGGRAGAMLGGPLGGIWASPHFWIVGIGLGTLLWALWTGRRIWKILQTAAVFGLLGVIVLLSWQTYRAASGASLGAGDGSLPFMLGVDLVVAMPVSWMPLVADYSRFGKSTRSTYWSTWWGYFLVSSWMYLLGLGATLVTGDPEPHLQILQLMGTAGLAVPALLMVVFSTITSDFPDIYSASCSILNLSDKISAKALMWITGIVSVLVALLFPMERYESFLYFIGAMFVPLFGVVLTDYFLLRRRQVNLKALFDHEGEYGYHRGFNVVALVSWALGFGAYEAIELLRIPTGGTLPSIFLTGALYYLLSRWRR
jgi:NCS1 family nucleobase:cation symporter-1